MDEEHLRDLFASLPAISIRRMFGGQGIYCDGIIIAVVLDGELYLKCDPETEAAYEAAGCDRWRYTRPGRAPVAMPYYRLPDEALEDADEMARWALVAVSAARNAVGRKASGPSRKRASPRA